jgi:hypothetical protein
MAIAAAIFIIHLYVRYTVESGRIVFRNRESSNFLGNKRGDLGF